MASKRLILRVLFISYGDICVAQALEHDITAQGRSIEEAKRAFERAFVGQVLYDRKLGRQPIVHLEPAPVHYWHQWHEAAERQQKLSAESIESPDPDAPQAFMLQAFSEGHHHTTGLGEAIRGR